MYNRPARQVAAVKGMAFNTRRVSAVTQTPDSRLPSSLAALLETPLRTCEIKENVVERDRQPGERQQ